MKDVVGEIGRLGLERATRAASRASTLSSLAISCSMIRILQSWTMSLERLGHAGEVGIDAAEGFLAGRVDQQPADEVGELVAGRPLDRPVLAQTLMPRQDLLDNEIERLRRLLAQADAIALGIEQTVDMVDPQMPSSVPSASSSNTRRCA